MKCIFCGAQRAVSLMFVWDFNAMNIYNEHRNRQFNKPRSDILNIKNEVHQKLRSTLGYFSESLFNGNYSK